jgi:hypothetical protein
VIAGLILIKPRSPPPSHHRATSFPTSRPRSGGAFFLRKATAAPSWCNQYRRPDVAAFGKESWRVVMRITVLALAALLSLAACGGHEERPVVVTPTPGSTVVVPPANSGQPPVVVTPRQQP